MKYVIILCLFFQALSISAFGQAYKYHTVAGDETISTIASEYDISKETIYKYNPDAKNGIQAGMKLVIALQDEPENSTNTNDASAVSFKSHKVEKKQTLYSLSKLYDVSIDDIKKYNKQLYSKELQNGETIRIPVFAEGQVQTQRPARQSENAQPSSTREHVVIPKETKYGIARKYGMTVKELEALNPTVDELHPGVMLKVSTDVLEDEPVIITEENFEFYEVKPQETLYSLTRRFQVEQDSLIALNPALEEGLKSGMVLKVPTRDAEGKELEDVEDEFEEGVVEEMNLENHLNDFSTKDLVIMLPFNLNKVQNDSVSNATSVLQNDRVMRISVDFYSGVLMAVEKAKELGISTNLRVFDTEQNQAKVSEIIRSNNFDGVEAVIGPLLQATSEEAASSLRNSNVPVISPISNRDLRSLPNLYQARPSDEMLREAMIQYLRNNSEGKNIIIIADAASGRTKSRLLEALPTARTVNPSGNNISQSAIANAIVKGKENWVILESESVSLLSSTTSDLNRMARNNDIVLFTTNKNNSFESDVLSNEHLGRLKFHFPSEYKEYDENVRSSFVDDYVEEYGVIPNKYTIRGYDLTMDILLRLGAMGSLENSVNENVLTEYVENKFLYKPRPNGGFHNDAIYIMHLNEDLTLSVARNEI